MGLPPGLEPSVDIGGISESCAAVVVPVTRNTWVIFGQIVSENKLYITSCICYSQSVKPVITRND